MNVPFRIKCCGITRAQDGAAAWRLGFDAVGLVFARRSKRLLTPNQARTLRQALPAPLAVVALFMDNPAAEVGAVVQAVQPDLLQFHGSEDNAWCAQFGVPWIKSVAMGEGAAALSGLSAHPGAAALLLDGNAAGAVGGEGVRFDWSLVPRELARPWILAGGLNPQNVAAAIRETRPWGVDVSSGVESSPGCKDAIRMERFVAAVRGCRDALSE